jgi:hypothetical protein
MGVNGREIILYSVADFQKSMLTNALTELSQFLVPREWSSEAHL